MSRYAHVYTHVRTHVGTHTRLSMGRWLREWKRAPERVVFVRYERLLEEEKLGARLEELATVLRLPETNCHKQLS